MKINRIIFKLTWKIIIFNYDHFAKFIENMNVITSFTVGCYVATALQRGNQIHLRGVKIPKKFLSHFISQIECIFILCFIL